MASNISSGSVDYSDDPILPAWYVPGWTAQNQETATFSLPAPAGNIAPYNNLPSNITYVQVSGTYTDGNGNNLGGYLTFEQSNDLLIQDPAGTYFRVPKRFVGNIPTANLLAFNMEGSGRVYIQFGVMNVILLANDQPNATVTIQETYNETQEAGFVQPTSWVYHVKEYFYRGMAYDISVPSTSAPGPVDINTLIVPNTLKHNHDWNRGY